MLKEYLRTIADAIRAKLGTTDAVNAQNFPNKVSEVYDKGRTDEWSDFWDVLQNYGKRTNYGYAFSSNTGEEWTDRTFKPKYDIKPTGFERAMRRAPITNIEESLERCGVVLDTSNCTTLQLAFSGMNNLEVLPTIDLSNATDTYGTNAIFSYTPKLHTIRKLIVVENITFVNTFVSCDSLQNIRFEGIIGADISFALSPLTVESMKSIISCLKDYSTENQGTYTLTLKDECKTALEADTETVEFNGQTYTYFNLITAKGWNLA